MTVPITGAVGVGGCMGIVTFADGTDTQPASFVTVKLYVPGSRYVMVILVPVPQVVIVPGYSVIIQPPDDGNPNRFTLPVGSEQVGGVIVPIDGSDGVSG